MSKRLSDKSLRRMVDKVQQRIAKARFDVLIGVEDIMHDSGLRMATLAAIHEYGTEDGHIPARAPFSKTIHKHSRKYARGLARATKAALSESLAEARQLGAVAASDVQSTIAAGLSPPNAKSTIRQKGSSKPLIDDGDLRQSITYEVKS